MGTRRRAGARALTFELVGVNNLPSLQDLRQAFRDQLARDAARDLHQRPPVARANLTRDLRRSAFEESQSSLSSVSERRTTLCVAVGSAAVFFFFRGLTRSSTVPWRAGWTPSSPSTCLPRRLPPSHRPSAAPTPWPSASRTLSNGSLTWHAKIEVKIFFAEQRSRASRSGVGGGCCPRERDHATDGFRVSAGRRVLQWAAAEAARATRGDAARR